jgi:uncharacterized membrane protein YgaE (UPF0421/DUF939 family)
MAPVVPALQLSVRAALAAALALVAARLFSLPYPLYAMIAAVIVTDLDPAKTRKLGLPRMAGTVLGAVLGALLLLALPPGIASIAAGIFCAMFTCHLLGMKDAAKLAGYLCALVLLEHSDSPWSYAVYRVAETLIGVVMAIAVSLVPKLLRADKALSQKT